jgi:hypothetical protein
MARKWFTLVLVVAFAALVWQWVGIRKLMAEREQIRADLAHAEAARANHDLTATSSNPANEEKLRTDQAELNRLRGEVSQLRKEVKAAQLAAAKRAAEPVATNAPAPPIFEVQKYAANVEANVPFNQTLVTGGWKLPSGKHALFFIEPQPGDSPDQISVQTKIVELSEEALAAVGLDALKSDSTETTEQFILSEAQARTVLRALEQREGVDVLGAPRLLTLSGRQAQVKIANVFSSPSGEQFETGPMIDLVPTISADGRAADLRVSAQMRLRPNR